MLWDKELWTLVYIGICACFRMLSTMDALAAIATVIFLLHEEVIKITRAGLLTR